MSNISIVKKSITAIKADAIVNAANSSLAEGGGVCGAIFAAAGSKELTKACSKYGHCDTGKAVITPAFNLPAKYVIHAVGPIWNGGKHEEAKLLYSAYQSSLELAKDNDVHSIVFPLISAGIFGYPKKEAWEMAIGACRHFIDKNEGYEIDIIFAVLDDKIIKLGNDELKKYYLIGEPGIEIEVMPKEFIKSTALDRVKVFQDTLAWIDSDDVLSKSVTKAKKATTLYWEDDYPAFDASKVEDTKITVTKHRSYEAAMKLHKDNPDSKIAVMNFANAFHAGGGVVKGSPAQEECLCRTSTLYPLLYRRTLRDTFYKHHKDLNTSKASDALLYTEGVIICKTDEEFPKRMPKEDWVSVDVITVAAPDLRTKSNIHAALVGNGTYMNDAELFGYHVKRAIHVLTCAAAKGADTLVLGAFGCGAFENNPKIVAKAYKVALEEFPKVFKRIEFAIYCPNEKARPNFEEFSKAFK